MYSFAGKIRDKNISKDNFVFTNALYLNDILDKIEKMDESTFDNIKDKCIEMNIAHLFMEGNGRTTRIWLDLILENILMVIDWNNIEKSQYLNTMRKSVYSNHNIKKY